MMIECHGHNDAQSLRSGDQLLESPTVFDPIAWRRAQTCIQALANFRDEATEIAVAHVGGDDDAALAVLPVDLVRPRAFLDLGHFAQGHELRLTAAQFAPRDTSSSLPCPARGMGKSANHSGL